MRQCIRPLATLLFAASLPLLTGCLHTVEVQQGNIIEPHTLTQLHKGMTEPQVIKLLGRPMLKNLFAPNQLVYVYTLKRSNGAIQKKQLQIRFNNGRIAQITSHW